jgi:hypothetical protein
MATLTGTCGPGTINEAEYFDFVEGKAGKDLIYADGSHGPTPANPGHTTPNFGPNVVLAVASKMSSGISPRRTLSLEFPSGLPPPPPAGPKHPATTTQQRHCQVPAHRCDRLTTTG